MSDDLIAQINDVITIAEILKGEANTAKEARAYSLVITKTQEAKAFAMVANGTLDL